MSGNGKNPFEFDVDFDQLARRRDLVLARKAAERGETLMQGMDRDDNVTDLQEDTTTEAQESYGGFRGFNFWGRSNFQQRQFVSASSQGESKESLSGGKKITQWPFDDYHLIQQEYYSKVAQMESSNKKDDASRLSAAAAAQNLQRPPDPPMISKAVQELPLNGFEQKAEERAIAIVSTWLFDAGLIDELLENGGMSTAAIAKKDFSDNVSVPSQEGIELGLTAGLPIEGPSKMDKEMNKLKSSQQRTLALINSRLNDGVAASGGEVQELVNAVNSTKDELGRLRELSTYISNTGGDMEQAQQNFMLQRFPKLKKAINARRNLAKCFRELDFYSKIPVTCDELRDALHSAEWTENEWYSLRNVSKKHVDLEIFLVEAEAGMKKRIKDEKRQRSSGRMTYKHEEVDLFLQDHVKNVWELGEEIRMRIQSGIGGAFDLAMNNPSGMVALVEAVEHYESANFEYKAVHGEEAGKSQSLGFTNMRSSALKQLYQDFNLRAEEMFSQVHEAVSE